MPHSSVTSVRIQRFKRITDATLALRRVNILVGANNAGKSSALHAIQFSVSIAQSGKLFAPDPRRFYTGTLAPQQLVYTPLRDVEALAPDRNFTQSSGIAVTLHMTNSVSTGQCRVTAFRGKNRNVSYSLTASQFSDELADIETPFSVYVTGLAGIPAFEEFKSPGVVRKAAARGDANSVFRNVLWQLRQDDNGWRQFILDLRTVFPRISVGVTFNEHVDDTISATVNGLPIDSAGTGILQTIQILSYVNVYRPALLLLDEPDSHLHPSNQRLLAQTLSDVASRRDFQILLATHSRHMIDALADTASVLWLSQGTVRSEPFDQVKTLVDLGALDRVDSLSEGRYEYVILTEDSDTSALEAILASSSLPSAKAVVRPYDGVSKINAAMLLAEYIRRTTSNVCVLLHRDRDYLSDVEVEDLRLRLRRAGLVPLITNNVDVESELLEPSHLGALFPEISPERIEELLGAATDANDDKSLERLVNQRTKQEAARVGGLGHVNNGQVAALARKEYFANKVRYRYGKAVAGTLRSMLQQELARNVSLASPTDALGSTEVGRLLSSAANNLEGGRS